MKQGGRPRRSEEQPDSAFGDKLKEYLRHVKNFTQAELAKETLIAEKTISNMVKGKRVRGDALRRDLRAIIEVLFKKGAIQTLEEANALITTIAAVKELDERDPEDAKIIALFAVPVVEVEPLENKGDDDNAHAKASATFGSQEDISLAEEMPEKLKAQSEEPSPGTGAIPVSPGRKTKKRLWWSIISLVVVAIIILGIGLVANMMATHQSTLCPSSPNGVTLYTDEHFQGQCHTFGPGSYELAQYGLEENVSSIRDPHGAYHITLYDKGKNFTYIDADTPVLTAEWDNRADTMLVEKNRPTSCHPGTNGIIAFINTDYSGGCLFITGDIADLTPMDFDQAIVSLQFVGSYQNTRQLVLYSQPNYKDRCGAYWQDQSDLLQCARIALSLQVLPFTPPTPVPTMAGTHYAGNIAPVALLSLGGTQAVVDGNLQTEWVGGHMVELDLHWAFPVTIHRVVVWDRKQSASDNNQINKIMLAFSDGTSTGSLDMISQGPRCVDVTFPDKTVSWVHIIPIDASGNNGYSEVEVWATTGIQYSNNTCVNKKIVTQMIPHVAMMHDSLLINPINGAPFGLVPFQPRGMDA